MTRTTYTEGTSVSVGAYIPNDGNLYGLQIVNYISGIKISASTNANLSVTRNSTLNSNFLFGLAHTVQTNATRISITKDFQIDDIKQ